MNSLSDDLRGQAEAYHKEDTSKTVYRSDSDALQNHLQTIGDFVQAVLRHFQADSVNYGLLKRVFDELYLKGDDGKVVLRDKKTISVDSVQNPNDPDAGYREKHDQKVQGYVSNFTETPAEKDKDGKMRKPSIITSVLVEKGGYIPDISISKTIFCPFGPSQRGIRLTSDIFYKSFSFQDL